MYSKLVRPSRPKRSGGAILAAALTGSLLTLLLLPASGSAIAQAKPENTAEPRISGSTIVGATLTASQGSWSGQPTGYAYQWLRCPRSGSQPDGSNCATIGGATTASYVAASADVDSRLRVRVTATNADGSATATSNPSSTVRSDADGRPRNLTAPSISGQPAQGATLRVSPGTWAGQQPITFSYDWLRCDTAGNNCSQLAGNHDDAYVVREGDVGKTMRARFNARNSDGSSSRLSPETAVVQGPQGPDGVITLPNGEKSIPVTSVPPQESLVVDQVQFGTNPIRSRTEPFQVRIKVEDTRGYVIRDAQVFFRSTPLVTDNPQNQKTGQDGWLTLTVVPEPDFPELSNDYNVQFYVKAFRAGDPVLGGVAGTRLVQVPLAR